MATCLAQSCSRRGSFLFFRGGDAAIECDVGFHTQCVVATHRNGTRVVQQVPGLVLGPHQAVGSNLVPVMLLTSVNQSGQGVLVRIVLPVSIISNSQVITKKMLPRLVRPNSYANHALSHMHIWCRRQELLKSTTCHQPCSKVEDQATRLHHQTKGSRNSNKNPQTGTWYISYQSYHMISYHILHVTACLCACLDTVY